MVLALGSSSLNSARTIGHVVERELIEHGLFFAEGEHRDAFHFALEHAAHAGGEHGGIAVGRADQNLVAVGDGDLFEALDQFREERIGDVFNDDAEKAAAAGDQGARVGVGKVVQLLDRLPNALGELFADDGRAVDGARNRGDGNLGQCGHGPNVGRFVGAFATCFSSHVANPEYS